MKWADLWDQTPPGVRLEVVAELALLVGRSLDAAKVWAEEIAAWDAGRTPEATPGRRRTDRNHAIRKLREKLIKASRRYAAIRVLGADLPELEARLVAAVAWYRGRKGAAPFPWEARRR